MDTDAGKIRSLRRLLDASRKVRIVVHTHPDGDAIGSGTALAAYLRESCGKDAALIVPDAPPSSLSFLPGSGEILTASADMAEAQGQIAGADMIMVLDLNDFARTEGLSDALKGSSAVKVLIDHHLNPDLDAFDLAFSSTEVSSTCELLYFILKDLERGDISRIPAMSLYSLMAGMTTDTNNFANSVYPGTLQMAGELLTAGVDRDDILRNLYQSDRVERLEAFADILSRRLKILPCGLAYIILDREAWDTYGLAEGETEGLVNIPLKVADVKMSVFLREEGGLFRVSIRAKKGWSANRLAGEHFHGGGHLLAAGGKLKWPGDIARREDAAAYIEDAAARFMQKCVSL